MSKALAIFAVFTILVASGFGWYYFSRTAGNAVTIDVVKPDRVLVGTPFIVTVGVGNASRGALLDAQLSLELPEGAVFPGSRPEKNIETKSLGRLGDGSVVQEEFTVFMLGGAQSVKRFTARVVYATESVGSRFEQAQSFDVVADAPAITLDLTAPESAVGGEEFGVDIAVKNMSESDTRGLQLTFVYPPGFEFKKATLLPDVGQNIWRLGDLRKGSETTLGVRGNLLGVSGSVSEFQIQLEAEFFGQRYLIGEQSARVNIAESPLAVMVAINDNPAYVASPNEALAYTIQYENTSDQPLLNAIIKAELRGDLFDLATLTAPNGAIAPAGNSVAWSAATSPELAVIAPRSSGLVTFTVRMRPQFTIRRLGDRNAVLKADVRVDAFGAPKGAETPRVAAVARLETKVKGAIAVDARVYFRDAAAGILNKGPIPPRVGVPTNYTVHWLVKNYTTDVSGVSVRARLSDNVRMTGVVKGISAEAIAYDGNTQEVVWNIDRISATKGVIDAPLEAVFQIEATPSPNLASSYMPLIGETVIAGKDEFTGSELRATDGAIATSLPDDSTIGSQGGIVIQ